MMLLLTFVARHRRSPPSPITVARAGVPGRRCRRYTSHRSTVPRATERDDDRRCGYYEECTEAAKRDVGLQNVP
jgi:hypothetical protein